MSVLPHYTDESLTAELASSLDGVRERARQLLRVPAPDRQACESEHALLSEPAESHGRFVDYDQLRERIVSHYLAGHSFTQATARDLDSRVLRA